MKDQDLRMACLEIAHRHSPDGDRTIQLAAKMMDFVLGKPAAKNSVVRTTGK